MECRARPRVEGGGEARRARKKSGFICKLSTRRRRRSLCCDRHSDLQERTLVTRRRHGDAVLELVEAVLEFDFIYIFVRVHPVHRDDATPDPARVCDEQ